MQLKIDQLHLYALQIGRYAAGAAVAAMAVLLQWLLGIWTGGQTPFLFTVPAVAMSAVALGRGPGSMVMAAGALYGWLQLRPDASRPISVADLVSLCAYAAVAGAIVFYAGRVRVINARAALTEEHLKLAQEDTGIGIYELDFGNNTAYVSPSMRRLLGQRPGKDSVALDSWLGALNRDHVADTRRALEEHVARGELRYEREQRVDLDDGHQRWLLTRVRIELDAAGSLGIARGATVDITERKHLDERLQRTQHELRAQDRRFAVALESADVPFNILVPLRDGDGRLVDFRWTYINSAGARLFKRAAADIVGRRIEELLPSNWDTPGLLERYAGVLDRGDSVEFETAASVHNPGLWFHVVAVPLQESIAVWFSDISERKRQERERAEADRRKDEFLATLAHELRNPLAPIRQSIRIARSDAATDLQRRWSHDVIERQVQNMALLLDDLLDVSRISRGTLLLRKSVTDLATVVSGALEVARPHIEAKNHELVVSLPDAVVTLEVDELRVAQVIGNLLTNAAKYTDPGGRISLRAAVDGEQLTVSVADTGIGLAPDQIAAIFEMFAQTPAAVGRAQGGLGIGLSLSRSLVRLHGGEIDAASPGVGRGSEFTLRLPGAVQFATASPAHESAPATA